MTDQQPNHYVQASELVKSVGRGDAHPEGLSLDTAATVALTHAVLAVSSEVNALTRQLATDMEALRTEVRSRA
jgi:hypothetical protein